ncbi:MAG: hypothetical protein SFW36_17695, partial [Leptolyngbyaceae cyanobacterium bins.59]|nr:hypothetical protein [Leptolyngbyaceae cyanobacterium bins.59]
IPGPKGSRKVVQLWCGDFNWLNPNAGTVDGNRYAIVITDALAKQLLGVADTEVDWSWEVLQYTKQYVGTTGHFIYPSLQPTEEPQPNS